MAFYDDIYRRALAATGNPEFARLAAAQATLETGHGKHMPGNNLFGIKSHGRGGGQTLATTEVVDGEPVLITSSFRQYGSPEESIADWQAFLHNNPRYAKAGLFEAESAEGMADALQRAGYATDPNYASKLKSIMNRGASGLTPPGGQAMNPYMPPPPPAPPMVEEPTGFGALMMDPIMAIGLGMLSSSMAGGNFGQALQAGMLGGQNNMLAMQRLRERQQDRGYRYQMERYKYDVEAAQRARRQELLGQVFGGSPTDAAMFELFPEAVGAKLVEERFRGPPPAIPEDLPEEYKQAVLAGDLDLNQALTAARQDEAARRQERQAEDTEVTNLRKEYDRAVADPKTQMNFWERVRDIEPAAAEKNAADQRTFMVAFAKMMEPSAAVMANDEEALRVAAATNPMVRDFQRRWLSGGLNKEELSNMKDRMRENASLAVQTGAETWGRYQELAEIRAGPERVREVVGRAPMGMAPRQVDILRQQRMPTTPPPGTDIGGGFSIGGS